MSGNMVTINLRGKTQKSQKMQSVEKKVIIILKRGRDEETKLHNSK
jgi:hypothetical protein